MSVTLYLAPAAGGKTAFLVNRARALAQGLSATPRVIVPTQLQARAWKQRLAEAGGVLGVHIGTFDTLYRDILDAADKTIIRLSEPIQYRLLRSLIAEAPLECYRPLRAMPGFVQAVQDLIRELKAGGVAPEAFAGAIAALGNEPRLADLAWLYTAYQRQLQQHGWADFAGIGWLAAEALEEHPEIGTHWAVLFVDGFDDLSTVQRRVLHLLAPRIAELTLTLTGAPAGEVRDAVHKRFHRTRQVLESDLGVSAQPLPAADFSGRAAALAHLEATFLTGGELPPVVAQNALTCIAAPDREGEVRAALRWLKQRCIHEDLRLGEVALLARNCSPYRPFIIQIAEEFGIPLVIAAGLPLRQNPAVNALLDLLRLTLPEAPFPWRPTVTTWRSPYFDWERCVLTGTPLAITAQTAELLEQVARWGSVIQGLKQWDQAFTLLEASGEAEDPVLSTLADVGLAPPAGLPVGAAAAALHEQFKRFVARITPPAGPQPCRTFVAWVEALMGELTTDSLPADEAPLPVDAGLVRSILAGPPDLALRDLAALNAFKDILRGLVWAEEVVACAPTSFDDFFTDLTGALEAATYHLPLPAAAQNLLVADVAQARGLAFRAVAVLGLAEGEFPATLTEDPLLRDADRQRLRDDFNLAVELSTDSAEAEYAYEAFTRASQALLLTRPRIADNGALWQASPYWEEVRRRIRVDAQLLTGAQQPPPEAAASEPELWLSLAATPALWTQAQQLRPERGARLEHAASILRHRVQVAVTSPYDGDLSAWAPTFARRFGPDYTWSASRLETYRTCPFFFFISQVLRLEPRQIPAEGLGARQLGNIYHHIFEAVYNRIAALPDLEALLAALPEVAAEILDAAPRREQFRPTAWWEQTRAEITAHARRSLAALTELAEGFISVQHEAPFGLRGRPPLRVEDSSGDAFLLRGLIDRVERAPGDRVRIIDYKTAGKSGFNNRAIAEGKKLQLPLYALAAQEALGLGTVVDGFYWHIQQAEHSDFTLAGFGGGPASAIETAVHFAWEAVQGARAGAFAPEAPAGGCPAYCPAASCCWRYVPRAW
ncbi:MAG: PD-(D/E)XK nuclease family protein [Anaerolineae bacterium]|jgi:ATP-dependent helicase/DNAse subunit B|nr:PD-(D/E)XK nuclease family protein [Anaerolineae bacterium]